MNTCPLCGSSSVWIGFFRVECGTRTCQNFEPNLEVVLKYVVPHRISTNHWRFLAEDTLYIYEAIRSSPTDVTVTCYGEAKFGGMAEPWTVWRGDGTLVEIFRRIGYEIRDE